MKKNVLCLCDNTPDTPWVCMGVYTLKSLHPFIIRMSFTEGVYPGVAHRVTRGRSMQSRCWSLEACLALRSYGFRPMPDPFAPRTG